MTLLRGRMKNLTRAVVLGVVFTAVFFVADSVSAATAQFHVRYQNTVFFEGEIELPASGVSQVTAVNHTTKLEESREVNSKSILALLSNIDASSDAFRISTLEYYPEYGSLYIKCIEVAVESFNACDNWQYVVNGEYSYVGMDNYILAGDDNVWIYFGDIRRVRPNGGTVYTTKSELKAEQYQYEVNGWAPVSGYTIGIKKDGNVVATQAVDSQGMATFTALESGNYTAGLVEDYYFPITPFYVGLSAPSPGPTGSAAPSPAPTPVASEKAFDVAAAVQFIQAFQQSNGSISDVPMLNDWAAIAGLDVKNYLLSDPNPGTLLTDYERRAMALLALGIDPYSGTPTNYIEKIVQSFDGTQFGDAGLVNDDIFALVPLLKAGYSAEDEKVQKSVAVILAGQGQNGSWIDTDLTAAAIQALEPVSSLSGVQEALAKAKTYLESKKRETGSFGNAYSTSWAMQALKALGESVSSSSLAAFQAEDGGLLKDDSLSNRIWATAYAIPAAEGKSWNSILQSFEKSVTSTNAENLAKPSSIELGLAKLLAIQAEVQRIEFAVAVLEPQVALLYNQHLAKVQEEQRVASITQEIARVQNEIAVLQASQETGFQKEVEPQAPVVAEERSLALAQVASVESAFPESNGFATKQIVLLIVAASAIFLLAGGTNLVSPLLKKVMVRTQ